MTGHELLRAISQMAESVERVSGLRPIELVVPDEEFLRPVFEVIGLRGATMAHFRSHGACLFGLSVRVDPSCPPDRFYVLPAPWRPMKSPPPSVDD